MPSKRKQQQTSWTPNRKVVAGAILAAVAWLLAAVGVYEVDQELQAVISAAAYAVAAYFVPEA